MPIRCYRIDTLVLTGGVVLAGEKRRLRSLGLATTGPKDTLVLIGGVIYAGEGNLLRSLGLATTGPTRERALWPRCGFEPGACQRFCDCAL
jgi:hypothetical protein